MPNTTPSREDQKRARIRATEWREFRQRYLFTQTALADALLCCRRTVMSIESGREVINPHPDLLRRFRDLKRQQERAVA